MKKFLQDGFEKIVKWSIDATKDKAKLQNITGTIAWGVSCLAYVGAIAINQNVPSDQKKFLIPQELADGAINVGLFFSMTAYAKKLANKNLMAGKILPKDLKNEILAIKQKHGNKMNLQEIEKHLSPKSLERMGHFKVTYPLLVSLTGSAIASNIVTPVVRNIVASKIQDKAIERQNLKQSPSPLSSPQNEIRTQKNVPQVFRNVQSSVYSNTMKI
ncbi:MAG: hypothetical protein PHE78_07945 [Candidatus Gastranaerophilales bacterium]|nr:hypothetical protein [Candidatus Gastranaerophilales bacterium]